MKSDKTIFQQIHDFWYVKSDTPDKKNCLDSKGEFNLGSHYHSSCNAKDSIPQFLGQCRKNSKKDIIAISAANSGRIMIPTNSYIH